MQRALWFLACWIAAIIFVIAFSWAEASFHLQWLQWLGIAGSFFSRRVACGPQFFPCTEAIVKYLGINSLLYAAVFFVLRQVAQKRSK